MVTRPIVIVLICVGFFLILQALAPKAMALKNPKVNRFMMEGHRTSKKKNYMVQGATDKEFGSFENGVAYDVEPFEPDRNPEELSAFIVDYANMIRNDVILLDKSVETRTRKRGNIKVKKYNQMIPDLPCKCNHTKKIKYLGEDVFPQHVETRICNGVNSCTKPFVCRENKYNLTILNKREFGSDPNEDDFAIHANLEPNWYAVQVPISVGCFCASDYVNQN